LHGFAARLLRCSRRRIGYRGPRARRQIVCWSNNESKQAIRWCFLGDTCQRLAAGWLTAGWCWCRYQSGSPTWARRTANRDVDRVNVQLPDVVTRALVSIGIVSRTIRVVRPSGPQLPVVERQARVAADCFAVIALRGPVPFDGVGGADGGGYPTPA